MSLSLAQVTIDCDDAAALAGFWSALLEQPLDPGASPFFATVGRSAERTGDTPVLMFLKVDAVKQTKNRVHLDLHAPDWVAQAERAVSLGAKHLADFDEHGTRWATLLDPEGNEFDIGAATG